MVVDVGEIRKHIKPKADSTLRNMRKDDLIEYIRCLEHNYNVSVSFNENQAKYIESLDAVEVVRCKDCKHQYKKWVTDKRRKDGGYYVYFCMENEDPFCGHVMGGTDEEFCSHGEKKDGA